MKLIRTHPTPDRLLFITCSIPNPTGQVPALLDFNRLGGFFLNLCSTHPFPPSSLPHLAANLLLALSPAPK